MLQLVEISLRFREYCRQHPGSTVVLQNLINESYIPQSDQRTNASVLEGVASFNVLSDELYAAFRYGHTAHWKPIGAIWFRVKTASREQFVPMELCEAKKKGELVKLGRCANGVDNGDQGECEGPGVQTQVAPRPSEECCGSELFDEFEWNSGVRDSERHGNSGTGGRLERAEVQSRPEDGLAGARRRTIGRGVVRIRVACSNR